MVATRDAPLRVSSLQEDENYNLHSSHGDPVLGRSCAVSSLGPARVTASVVDVRFSDHVHQLASIPGSIDQPRFSPDASTQVFAGLHSQQRSPPSPRYHPPLPPALSSHGDDLTGQLVPITMHESDAYSHPLPAPPEAKLMRGMDVSNTQDHEQQQHQQQQLLASPSVDAELQRLPLRSSVQFVLPTLPSPPQKGPQQGSPQGASDFTAPSLGSGPPVIQHRRQRRMSISTIPSPFAKAGHTPAALQELSSEHDDPKHLNRQERRESALPSLLRRLSRRASTQPSIRQALSGHPNSSEPPAYAPGRHSRQPSQAGAVTPACAAAAIAIKQVDLLATATQQPPTPMHRWTSAVKSIQTMANVSKRFYTLRDMTHSTAVPRESIQVISVLGKGAFCIVEKCLLVHPDSGYEQLVAVKRLKPDLTNSAEDIESMMREVALLRKIKHRYIVNYIGYGHWDFATTEDTRQQSLFIVEELVDGGSLKTLVQCQQMTDSERLYRCKDALRWLRQMAEGLAYLHNAQPQVIHRDLKLENVLIKGRDVTLAEAKMADFGLSALVRVTSGFQKVVNTMRTPSGRPKGGMGRSRRASADMETMWAAAARDRRAMSGVTRIDQHLQQYQQKLDQELLLAQQQGRGQQEQQAGPLRGERPPDEPPFQQPAPVPGSSPDVVTHISTSGAGVHEHEGGPGVKPAAPHSPSYQGDVMSKKLVVAQEGAQLSGRIGTLMYMAPEVYRQEVYNEKADVYSWAIIAYELLHRYAMISATDGSLRECQAYARRAARGFRPPLNRWLPTELVELLKACWAQDPQQRPGMDQVANLLSRLEYEIDGEAFDRALMGEAYTQDVRGLQPRSTSGPCCCM